LSIMSQNENSENHGLNPALLLSRLFTLPGKCISK
jgi:hypothetical protein